MALYSERVALVTGSSRGVGRLIAEHFLKQGATVIGVSRGGSDLTHEAYRHCQADVSDAAAVQALFGGLRTQGISVDIVVNNAAVLTSQYAMILPASAAQAMVNVVILLGKPSGSGGRTIAKTLVPYRLWCWHQRHLVRD